MDRVGEGIAEAFVDDFLSALRFREVAGLDDVLAQTNEFVIFEERESDGLTDVVVGEADDGGHRRNLLDDGLLGDDDSGSRSWEAELGKAEG